MTISSHHTHSSRNGTFAEYPRHLGAVFGAALVIAQRRLHPIDVTRRVIRQAADATECASTLIIRAGKSHRADNGRIRRRAPQFLERIAILHVFPAAYLRDDK